MANKDMLGRNLGNYAGSFSTDDTTLTFPGLKDASGGSLAGYIPYLVTSMGINYQQQVTRIYSLNMGMIALAAGRPQGNAQLAQVISPQGSFSQFYNTYGRVCNAKSNTLQFDVQAKCDNTSQFARQTFICTMATVVQFGVNVGAQDGVINNNMAMQFESMQYEDEGTLAAAVAGAAAIAAGAAGAAGGFFPGVPII